MTPPARSGWTNPLEHQISACGKVDCHWQSTGNGSWDPRTPALTCGLIPKIEAINQSDTPVIDA